ncbi:hypothetical protein CYMTET_39062 [Cymbomonas tetramitiformis]|uniref:Uncharacterized protein n=1 Tax=Cymbomonas tetramitiformis TaxID=36881 RepID=A0AAE0CAU3_9CHLO|nr:hypothetical protein CYMTET_39062 [Cymbomonas tetramitiformis]
MFHTSAVRTVIGVGPVQKCVRERTAVRNGQRKCCDLPNEPRSLHVDQELELLKSRREVLLLFPAAAVLSQTNPGLAEAKLAPAGYEELARELVIALQDSLLLEASGVSERKVRKNADPAKVKVQQFIQNYKGSPLLVDNPSYLAIEEALRILGSFYLKNGSRAKLPADIREEVLDSLNTAYAALS